MKPLNLDNRPCSPISSNCVIWQGPELTCINLCKGDTISDVVENLATELCTLLDQTNVSNYDLTCLGITACGPKDFQALIELLIEKICELQGLPTDNTKSDSTCPDCTVTVAPCFIQNGQTTMQLIDYVNMIAERVCGLISQINDLQEQINDLTIRVEILESTPPPTVTIPRVTFSCAVGSLNPGQPYPVDVALQTFINDVWCPMSSALGTPTELLNSIEQPCEFGTDVTSNPGWIANPTTLADSINNIWITLCELYDIVSNISLNVVDTNTVNLTLSSGILTAAVQDTGWVRLLGFDYIPDNNATTPPMVRRIGNVLHFRGTIVVPLANGGSALTWNYVSNQDSYFYQFNCTPFQGAGGVYTNPNGSVTFNYTGVGSQCSSVIPPSVLPAGYAIDGRYQNPAGWKIANRIVPIDYNPATQRSTNSTSLTTLFSQVIGTDGTLILGLFKDTEASWVSGAGGNNSFDTGHLNYIISHVTQDQNVPRYANAATTVYDNTTAVDATLPVNIRFEEQYYYPFTCNANFEDNVGGFFQRLDGLTAFISPCGATIPTPDPCPKGEL